MTKVWDYSGRVYAMYQHWNGDRIIVLTDQRPGSGAMVDRWMRDDGREDLAAIMARLGRELVMMPTLRDE